MSKTSEQSLSVVMIGATGAVGSETLKQLTKLDDVGKITLLGRREAETDSAKVIQHVVDVLNPESYQERLEGHDVAISTFGVGQPSKISKEEFLKIDRDAVLDFAKLCKSAGVKHFQSLGSIGVSSQSSQYYLRAKGELEDGMRDLDFERLSLFHPSMILTPQNRYGLSQAITLAVWPLLTLLLFGPLRKFRGVKVDRLGKAIANNILTQEEGEEVLEWDAFQKLNS